MKYGKILITRGFRRRRRTVKQSCCCT